jgi:hypothetical protein
MGTRTPQEVELKEEDIVKIKGILKKQIQELYWITLGINKILEYGDDQMSEGERIKRLETFRLAQDGTIKNIRNFFQKLGESAPSMIKLKNVEVIRIMDDSYPGYGISQNVEENKPENWDEMIKPEFGVEEVKIEISKPEEFIELTEEEFEEIEKPKPKPKPKTKMEELVERLEGKEEIEVVEIPKKPISTKIEKEQKKKWFDWTNMPKTKKLLVIILGIISVILIVGYFIFFLIVWVHLDRTRPYMSAWGKFWRSSLSIGYFAFAM